LRLAGESEGELGAGGSDGGVRVPLAAAMVMDSAVCDARAMGVREVQRAHARRQGEVGQAPQQTAQHHTQRRQAIPRLHRGPWAADVRAAGRGRARRAAQQHRNAKSWSVICSGLWAGCQSSNFEQKGRARASAAKQGASVQMLRRRSPQVIVEPITTRTKSSA
jgi:hypothetical protein